MKIFLILNIILFTSYSSKNPTYSSKSSLFEDKNIPQFPIQDINPLDRMMFLPDFYHRPYIVNPPPITDPNP